MIFAMCELRFSGDMFKNNVFAENCNDVREDEQKYQDIKNDQWCIVTLNHILIEKMVRR